MIETVRFNLIKPELLTDEHLNAEHVELIMLQKFINKYPNGNIPDTYRLGKGHMSFFRDKTDTVKSRLREVNIEMSRRYKSRMLSYPIIISEWFPNDEDIKLNVGRIIDRLRHPLKKKNAWHYYGDPILDIEQFIKQKYGEWL